VINLDIAQLEAVAAGRTTAAMPATGIGGRKHSATAKIYHSHTFR
jgi:hypothetical protein